MNTKEQITREINEMSASELEQVAQYLAFIKYQARLKSKSTIDESQLAALYAEFAEEDRQLAEDGIRGYTEALAKEDAG
jgi:DNA-binding GntR family transcriptional regulator